MEKSHVRVISNEILKPSSQTPDNLRNLKLSLIDRLVPPVYIPLIFFYQPEGELNSTSISQKLKQSFSDTLTVFYPLAGKLDQQNFVVECNDSGVTYIEARVDARLSDTMQSEPTTDELKHYLPEFSEGLLAVQINYFECGGIAVGVCMSHCIGDGASMVTFVNSWASTCRGVQISRPSFDLASYFPDRDLSGMNIPPSSAILAPEEILVKKRFVFDKVKLDKLREEVASGSNDTNDVVKNPSRVELVSAFIWKHFARAAISKKVNTFTAATQAVSLKKRMNNPSDCSLEHTFGNCVMTPVAIFDHQDADKGIPKLHDLIWEFRNKIRAIDNEYIQRLGNIYEEDGYLSDLERFYELMFKGGVEVCGFSSWCRFPMYEVDYGWGKPVWVSTTGFPITNFTILMDTKSGDGVSALVSTSQGNIESLENHFQLLSNAIVD